MHDFCFGGPTALRLVRDLGLRNPEYLEGRAAALPTAVPTQKDVGRELERLEALHLGVTVSLPAHTYCGSSARCRSTSIVSPHSCTTPLPKKALIRIDDHASAMAPGIAFLQYAALIDSLVSIMELGFEICGGYRTQLTSSQPSYQVPPLATVESLREFAAAASQLKGARKAARALRFVANGSESPRETKLALLLGLPMRLGGYGLGMPKMNHEVTLAAEGRNACRRATLRCDLCWPGAMLDVEYQSNEMHSGETDRIDDSRRANALSSMGWTVIGVTNEELESTAGMNAIASAVRTKLRLPKRIRVQDYDRKQQMLRYELGLVSWV